MLTCGDVEENPGPKFHEDMRSDDDDSDEELFPKHEGEADEEALGGADGSDSESGFETEVESEKKQVHPVLKQLDTLRKAGRLIDISLIMGVIVRFYQGADEEVQRVARLSQLEKEQVRLSQQLKRAQTRTAEAANVQDWIARKRTVDAELKRERFYHDVRANTIRFAHDKWEAYNRAMNPTSKEECEVPKEEVEKALEKKFAPAPTGCLSVPNYMPRVEEKMTKLKVTAKDLLEAMKGKKS